jgi:hypothetical protein
MASPVERPAWILTRRRDVDRGPRDSVRRAPAWFKRRCVYRSSQPAGCRVPQVSPLRPGISSALLSRLAQPPFPNPRPIRPQPHRGKDRSPPKNGNLSVREICICIDGPKMRAHRGQKRSKTGQKPSNLSCFTRFMLGPSRTLRGFLHPWNRTFFELRIRPFRL